MARNSFISHITVCEDMIDLSILSQCSISIPPENMFSEITEIEYYLKNGLMIGSGAPFLF